MIPFYLRETADRQMEFPVRVEWLQFGGWGAQYRMRRKNHCSLDKVFAIPECFQASGIEQARQSSLKGLRRFSCSFVGRKRL